MADGEPRLLVIAGGWPPPLPGDAETVEPGRGFEEALRAVKAGERLLLAGRGAWGLWRLAAREAWMRGENYFFLDAVDPREAEAAGVPPGQMLAARRRYAAKLSPREVGFEKLSLEKRVTRRALLASAFAGAVMAAVEEPRETSLCTVRGVGDACRACMERCGGASCSAALCSVELLRVPGYSREALLEYLRVLSPRGPGRMVFATRWLLADLAKALDDPRTRPDPPTVIVPVGCPYVVGLEELLAARGLGLEPVILAGGDAEDADPRCAASRGPYRDTVARDYEALTGEPLKLLSLDELLEELPRRPRAPEPLGDAASLLSRGLHSLAVAEAERLVHDKPVALETRLMAQVRVDEDKCTMCSACVQECPANALELDRRQGDEVLLHLPGRCIACLHCAEICPEDAIEARPAVPPMPGHWRITARSPMVHCIACGAPIATRRMIESVLRKMKAAGLPAESLRTVFLCDTCKAKYQLGALNPDWSRIPSWAKRIIGEG